MWKPLVTKILWGCLGICVFYLLWLPYRQLPRLARKNPKTTALIERRIHQARQKGKKFKPLMIWRSLGEISPNLVHAVILSEDDTFYQHHGIDWEQTWIAMQRDWEAKRFVYGGSTMTQQLARTLFLSPNKNPLRKLKEALITFWMERMLSKHRILELYLNVAEWGKGVYGAEAAAQSYFNKPADALTPDEAVALASILPSPRRWSPFSEKAFMARRRTQILERMKAAGYVPEENPALDTELFP